MTEKNQHKTMVLNDKNYFEMAVKLHELADTVAQGFPPFIGQLQLIETDTTIALSANISFPKQELKPLGQEGDYKDKPVTELLNNDKDTQDTTRIAINHVAGLCHQIAVEAGWWSDIKTGERKDRNKGELLMLMVSEIAEAMEGERKDLMDDHLKHRKMAEVELADTIIRIMDYCGAHGYDIGGALVEKLIYNTKRADHKPENRALPGGKDF